MFRPQSPVWIEEETAVNLVVAIETPHQIAGAIFKLCSGWPV